MMTRLASGAARGPVPARENDVGGLRNVSEYALEMRDYAFSYGSTSTDALHDISFGLRHGSFAVLCGTSGSGKSTLLRAFKPELAVAGESRGTVRVLGDDPHLLGPVESATRVGFVMQDPENQIVTDTVWHELAFGLESIGMDPQTMRRRVAEAAHFFGIGSWFDRRTADLSGGQKQLLNLAAIVVMQPAVLVLDEPTSQLDPIAAKAFLDVLERVNSELGITVVITEHRLEDVLPIADRVLLLERGGTLAYDGDRDGFAHMLAKHDSGLYAALPAATRMGMLFERAGRDPGGHITYPFSVREGRSYLADALAHGERVAGPPPTERALPSGDVVLSARDLWFRYTRDMPFVLRGVDFNLHAGRISALVGGNGSGKSTLLSALAGVRKPERGRVVRARNLHVALMAQNPKTLFVRDRLVDDLLEWSDVGGYSLRDVNNMLERLGLEQLRARHPYDLSGGETQKAALAKILLLGPDVLLLDEPTKGLDAPAKTQIGRILSDLALREGKAVLLTTHDLEFVSEVAHTCSMLFGHDITCTQDAHGFFVDNLFYSTPTARIARGMLDGCVTTADLAVSFGLAEGAHDA